MHLRKTFAGRRILAGVLIGVVTSIVITSTIASRHDPITPEEADRIDTRPIKQGGKSDIARPKIKPRVAPTVEVTFGSAADWAGRPKTAAIGQQPPWTPDRVTFITDLAKHYGSKSSMAVQGTVELYDDKLNPAWGYPLWAIAIEPAAAAELLGPDVGNALQRHQLVMSKSAAKLRKASTATSLTLAGWDDPIKSVQQPIGAIVEDERTLDAELLMSIDTATQLGLSRQWRIMVWGGDTKAVARDAASTVGSKYIYKSWTAPSVDSVLSVAELKQSLGEFAALRRNGVDPSSAGAKVDSDPEWVKRNIATADVPIIGRITCNKKLIKPITESLAEIEQAGLAPLIDVWDTRRAGGCWNSRLIRSASGTSGRNISRHSWGAALDINPSTNRYGGTSTMDERIVDVFRRHGFAWGGTFPIADGMHFEYIGKPRVKGPKLPPGTTSTTSTTSTSTTSTTLISTTTTRVTSTTSTAGATSSTLGVPRSTIDLFEVVSSPSTSSTSTTTLLATTSSKPPKTTKPKPGKSSSTSTTSATVVTTPLTPLTPVPAQTALPTREPATLPPSATVPTIEVPPQPEPSQPTP